MNTPCPTCAAPVSFEKPDHTRLITCPSCDAEFCVEPRQKRAVLNERKIAAILIATFIAVLLTIYAFKYGASGVAGGLAGGTFLFFILAVGGMIYFAPTLVAYYRGHHNGLAIAILNILLGWTFLGWVAALVWASTAVKLQRA